METGLFDLSGKTAIVTGGSRGIGEATAMLLADWGAHVVVTSRRQESCEAVTERIRQAGGQATALAAHAGETEALESMFATLAARGLGADILVNNAGTNPYFGPMIDMPLPAFERTVEVNIRGYYHATVLAARLMRERGGGAIVNVASVNARRAAPLQGAYSMTKAAIMSLTEGFAKELAGYHIRVNAVLPGLTETKFAAALTGNAEILHTWLKQVPLGRVAQPAEIAPMIAFLASPAAAYITGAGVPVDGGYLA